MQRNSEETGEVIQDVTTEILGEEVTLFEFKTHTTLKYDLRYATSEKTGFYLKYGMLPGAENTGNYTALATDAIENKISSMAADIYQTMISRNYVPNIIKQQRNIGSLSFKTSLGREQLFTKT